MVASFFLQIFALVTPLFFQVVIDKVLVHRGLTTLDVLVIGLVTLSIFESVLTALRTHVFAHTTNRMSNSGRGCSGISSRCPLAIFRRDGQAIPSRVSANSKTFGIF